MAASPQPSSATGAGELAIGGDMTVRRMGFGAMRITGGGIWGEPEHRSGALSLVRRAVELDVNLIDTADAYGPEVSENLIAEALHPYPEDLVIATKGGLVRRGPDLWGPDGRPEHLKSACEGSLSRLRVDTIDLYQLHTPDPNVPFEESVGALAELQAEGKVRHVGLSNVSVERLDQARSIVPIVSVQNRYNLATRDSEAVLDACERDGIGFIPWYPIEAGALANSPELREISDRHGATPAQLALAWLLQRSPVMLPIPGTSSQDHLEENIAAASIRLSDEELERVEAAVAA